MPARLGCDGDERPSPEGERRGALLTPEET